MTHRRATVLNGVLVAAMFALAFWTAHALPDRGQVATHWGPDGRPDAWLGGSAVQLINPIVALVLWFLLSTVPQGFASPGKPGFPVFFWRSWLAIQLLLTMHVLRISIF